VAVAGRRDGEASAVAEEENALAAEDGDRSDAYHVKLEMGWEGPLDLLLHLIKKHELDILDIPVSFVTRKYLEYLDLMRSLEIDVASEYLVMAATLAHIKSKMLLPADPTAAAEEEAEAEDGDPRADLVRRLLEYQKYKNAAAELGGRAAIGRDLFPRGTTEPVPEGQAPLMPVSVFKLFDAFERLLQKTEGLGDHHVMFERVGIAERIVELTELLELAGTGRVLFEHLFQVVDAEGRPRAPTRGELVVTFLALLEMCKMRIARITQDDPLGELYVELVAKQAATAESAAEPVRQEP
jgi:segregation and condensation protein A